MANLISCRESTVDKIRQHSGFSTTITDSFAAAGAFAVVWDNTDIFWQRIDATRKAFRGTGFSATIQNSFALDLAYDFDMDTSGNLFTVRASDKVYKHRSEEHTSELQSQSNLVC